ncbi:MAG: hypothetical protein HYW65_02580 [Candidatus Liptonbacteria bacterium]|nr:hypothetical protein [Candidatus Liptonbacteria bacterium]
MAHGGGGGGGGGAILALVLLLAFVVLVWIAIATFPPMTPGSLLNSSQTSTSTARAFRPPRGLEPARGTASVGKTPSSGGKLSTPPPAVPLKPTSTIPQVSPQDIPRGYTLEQLSPFFHKVRLNSINVGGFGLIGQAGLTASLQGDERVNVTDWRLQGSRAAFFVPKAVQVYDALGLAPETDVVMKSGDTFTLYSGGQSAVGKNLRLNKCLGYLPTINNFKPSIPRSCPYVNRDDIVNFSGQCQNYIYSLGSCGIPSFNDVRIPVTDYACRAYLEKLNYQGCVERYGQDKDFLQNQIYGWVGAIPFDQYHDIVRLLDGKGLLVNMYQY